ncbi:hypothetical protein FHR32_007951 [Streptosporangium album]|uniref:Uncharacterized protein n=1 Tax=Streptosporangium album TaxID=47479 RepID=A0A7W7S442_9ACTN|nr:hypothetical protein [Streptosporangium album]
MLAEVADWIVDQYEQLQTWADNRFDDDPTKSWGARLAWVLYGAGTVAMVYSASPAGGQLLATGIAVLYWAVGIRFPGDRPSPHGACPLRPRRHDPAAGPSTRVGVTRGKVAVSDRTGSRQPLSSELSGSSS